MRTDNIDALQNSDVYKKEEEVADGGVESRKKVRAEGGMGLRTQSSYEGGPKFPGKDNEATSRKPRREKRQLLRKEIRGARDLITGMLHGPLPGEKKMRAVRKK